MFKVRKTAPVYPEQPYNWDAASIYQCTWYAYYRALEVGFTPPCYWDRATRTGSYTNAKLWLDNFREPWEVKGPEYKPVAGDIAVFDGTYGHVVFIEKEDGLISEYNRIAKEGFDNDIWEFGGPLSGCGPLLGYLHFPNNVVNPVERNERVNQIQTTDTALRVRLQPSLSGEIYCHVQLGYYNVLSQTNADGYTWYEIEKGKYCANDTTIYLPSEDEDILKEIEQYIKAMQDKVNILTEENIEFKEKLKEIHSISEV